MTIVFSLKTDAFILGVKNPKKLNFALGLTLSNQGFLRFALHMKEIISFQMISFDKNDHKLKISVLSFKLKNKEYLIKL